LTGGAAVMYALVVIGKKALTFGDLPRVNVTEEER
jgi:hypothetical protein